MPIPAAVIPVAARLLGTAATRAGSQSLAKGATGAASKAGANALAKNSARTATSVCKQTGAARIVSPKKVPSHLASPGGLARPHSLNLKPLRNKLPSSQQVQNFGQQAFQKAEKSGLIDLAAELGANALVQHLTGNKPSDFSPDNAADSGFGKHNANEAGNNTTDFSASLGNTAASVFSHIQDALKNHQESSSHSANFSEPTIKLDENGLRQ